MIRLRRLFPFISCQWSCRALSLVLRLSQLICDFERTMTKDPQLHYSFKILASSTSSDSRLRKMAMMIPKPNRSFGRRHGHDDENEQLTRDVLKETRKRDERQVHGIEHQLNAHEHRDHVALDDHADHANREQARRRARDTMKAVVPYRLISLCLVA